MNDREKQIGSHVLQYQQLVKHRLAEIPAYNAAELTIASDNAFVRKHRAVEKKVEFLEGRLRRNGVKPQRQIEAAQRLRVCAWKHAVAELNGESGLIYAVRYAQD